MYNLADWSKAPEWANWYAVDMDGGAWWYSSKPQPGTCIWCWSGLFGGIEHIGCVDDMTGIDWRETLEVRP